MRPPRPLVLAILILFTTSTKQPPPQPQHIIITMERTPCFGRCPVYKVTLDEQGNITFTGTRFVAATGAHTAAIDPAKVRSLIDQARSLGFWSMYDKYDGTWGLHVTDVPSTITTITLDSQTKQVTDRVDPPENLQTLEYTIDQTANTAQWIESKPPENP